MHPLDSANRKTARAYVHIRTLEAAIRRYARGPKVTFSRQGIVDDPSRRLGNIGATHNLYTLEIDPSIRANCGLIIGDILSNLNAALDHIAWVLAVKYADGRGRPLEKKEAQGVKFPLRLEQCDKPFHGGLGKKDLKLLLPAAWDTIERFQPYNIAKWPELKLLDVLRHLTNEDKHRVVTPVRIVVDLSLRSDGQAMIRLDNVDKFPLVVRSIRDDFEPQPTFDVSLYVSSLSPNPLPVSEFRRIHNFIRDELIPAFVSFFP